MLLKRYKLMENPHGETGSNKNFSINKEDVRVKKIK
jgi:hypothetical protein